MGESHIRNDEVVGSIPISVTKFIKKAVPPAEYGLFDELGAGNRNRTYDLIITNDALYQLSYSGMGREF